MWPYQVSILFWFCSALWLVLPCLELAVGAVAGETEEGEQSTLHLFQENTYALQANNHSEIF